MRRLRASAVCFVTVSLALAAAAGEPSPDAVLATLPFMPSAAPNQIVIDLAPAANERRMPLQIDTGASVSFLSPGFARAMGVKVSRVRAVAYRRATVLGRDLQFHVDTRRTDTAANQGFEFGLIGGDFLAQYVVELDFAAHRVRFLDPQRFEVPSSTAAPGEAVLPLEVVANRAAVRVALNGEPVQVMVDTGAPFGLLLSGEIARGAGIASEPASGLRLTGVLGPIASEAGQLARFEIGPFAFEDLAAVVAPQGYYNQGFPGDSMIGYDLLAQFLVRIDYPRRRLWLRREPAAPPPVDLRKPEAAVAMSWTIPPEPQDALEARAPRSEGARQIWLEWKTPEPAQRVEGPVGWIPVEGWAGVGDPIEHDVVLVIDVSGSTAIASGVDVDEDGTLGRQHRRRENWRNFNPRYLSSDPGDTVLAAELVATRRLVELLDPDRTRIGIVAFSDGARILAPLGSDRARIETALHELEGGFGSGATDMGRAISRGTEALLAGQTPAGPKPSENSAQLRTRRMTLLVLSDGWPTAPVSPELAARAALDAASVAAQSGIRIDAFGLGLESAGDRDVYAQIASRSGGQYRALAQPAAVIHELPKIDLAEVGAIDLANATTGAAGRAVRSRPDGSFDGFVLLAPGENQIRVTARDDAGASRSDERTVFYDERAARSPEEADAFDRRLLDLRRTLEQRRLEAELVAEIEAARRQRRELEIRAEEP